VDRYLAANGIRLHYVEHEGDGPTLLLLHGLTANAHSFDGLIAAGLAPRLRVLAFDLRGRGLSEHPAHGYSIEDHAADVIDALDALGLDRVTLGGHSYGGLLTYHLAANYPARIGRCVFIDAPGEVDPMILEQIGPALQRLERVVPSWADYLAMVQAMPYYQGWTWDPELTAYYRADVEDLPDGTVRSRCRPEHIREAIEMSIGVDWPGLVTRVSQPSLFIRAIEPFGPPGYPPLVPGDVAERTVAILANARLAEFAGNHITMLFGDTAPAVAATIASFVEEG